MRILIVIPTYNERVNLERLVPILLQEQPENVHLCIVDDNSQDQSAQCVKEWMQKSKRVHLIERAGKLGLGTAYLAGFDYALKHQFEAAIEMDADFSHDPKFLKGMIAGLNTHDVVIGSRYVRGGSVQNWGWLRKCISRGGSLYARWVLWAPIYDFTGGFIAWRASALKRLNLETIVSNGYSFQIEMKYRAFLRGLKILEIPICFKDREEGVSKMSFKIFLEAIFRVVQLKFNAKSLKVLQ